MGDDLTCRGKAPPSPALEALECIGCAARWPVADHPRGCPACDAAGRGANLFCRYRPGGDPRDRQPYPQVPDLGQGATPLLEPAWPGGVLVKNEAANPTGSHKDRFAAAVTARARAAGYASVAVASSGNAGLAVAAFAAAAGLGCTVAGFTWLPEPVRRQLADLGARVRLFDTDRDRLRCAAELAERPDTLTVTNLADPVVGSNCFGIEGYKAIAWEIAEQAPAPVRHVVVPSSRGDLAWGIHRGFLDLAEALGAPAPRIHLVEPFPRLAAVLAGASVTDRFPGDPGRLHSIAGDSTTVQAHRVLTASGGTVTVVGDPLADEWFRRACRHGHTWERSSTTVFAAHDRLRRDGVIRDGEPAVLVATSHFFKGL